jgi:pimeloyl-ACP methyl ester carboxylesterase
VLIRVNGLETFYQLDGRGDPVVLLHGWGTSSQSLTGVAACLASGFRVFSVDLPGFGWSQTPAGVWGIAEYADHIRQFLDQMEITTAALLGHSFGGRIAIQLAAQHPARVSRLVLVASAGVRPARGARFHLRVGITKALRSLQRVPGLRGAGERLGSRWRARVGSRDYLAAGPLRPTLVKVVNEDLTPVLAMIQTPTLLLWGDQDQEVRRPAVEVMAANIPEARLTVFPGAGHFPFQDAPETFCGAVLTFLREGPGVNARGGSGR